MMAEFAMSATIVRRQAQIVLISPCYMIGDTGQTKARQRA
jgi:hypothetical protein